MTACASAAARLLVVLVLLGRLAAADVAVELTAKPINPAVGDPVQLEVTYRWPRGWIGSPDPTRELAGLFVTAAPPAEDRSSGGGNVRIHRFTILAERSGAVALPRFAFAASERSDREPVQAKAPEVVLQVGTGNAAPVLPVARPAWTIPPPEDRPTTPWWVWALIGGAVAVLMGGVIWFALRRRIHQITPEERFASELARTRALGDARDRAAALSLALRRFAGAAYGFDGVGATARETATLAATRAPESEAVPLTRLLDRLDGLRWTPDQLAAESLAPIETDADDWGRALAARLAEERKRQVKTA